MGKKKRSNQNTNSIATHEDSSESESSKDSTQTSEAGKTTCPHIVKAVDITSVRKTLKTNKEKSVNLICWPCKKSKSTACKDGWVCMRCGSCNCGPEEEDHRLDHYRVPRSDTHYIVVQINTSIVWCFKCEQEIPIDISKKVQSCADLVKKAFTDNLLFSPVQIETDDNKNIMKIDNSSELVNSLRNDTSHCDSFRSVSLNEYDIRPSLPRVRGLYNLGNTCFFNSVLQCLAQTPGLINLLREMDVPGEKFHLELDDKTIDAVLEKPVPTTKTSPILSEQLAQILTEVSGAPVEGDARAGSYTVNPRRLLEALTRKCPQFEGGDQHDAHELLRHLLDSVHSEDLRRYQKAILDHIGYTKRLDELDEEKKEFGKKLNQKVCETIPIRPDQIFKGSLVSILQCTVCSHVSKRDEPFLDLSLPVVQEKAQPPVVRRKQNCNSPVEDEQTSEVQLSKHQQKKQDRKERKNAKKNRKAQNGNQKEDSQGEPTIEKEDKKDSLDGEQSDADVEDNEDNVGEEQDRKTEIGESGYSSEKQMSARGSPITTQSPEEEAKYSMSQGTQTCPVFYSCEVDIDNNKPKNEISFCSTNTLLESQDTVTVNRAESGLGSVQELTVSIPEETNTECTSQESVRVNASNGSPDVSSDSQHSHFKTVDLTSVDYGLPKNINSPLDRRMMVQEWNCTGEAKVQSHESSSVSLPASPQGGSQSSQDNINNTSPKCSPKDSPASADGDDMSLCNSLQQSNDNMSVCNSLPENTSMVLNSPVKSQNSQKDDDSGSEERPESRMECQKSRSSPVEMRAVSQLDSGLLQLSLEEVTFNRDDEAKEGDRAETSGSKSVIALPYFKPEDEIEDCNEATGGSFATNTSPVPLPPPLPLLSMSYSWNSSQNAVHHANTGFHQKYRIEEGECSLQSCLNQFTTIEVLAGANKAGCEACTERMNKGYKEGKTVYQNSTKQLLIFKLPPVMIFHLKRFQVQRCSFRKISRHIVFPLVLDISQFCTKESTKNKEQMLYSLYGVVEHSGTLHGGHYVAYVKVRDQRRGCSAPGKWYYISDSHTREVDEKEVLNSQAYLLFYERIP